MVYTVCREDFYGDWFSINNFSGFNFLSSNLMLLSNGELSYIEIFNLLYNYVEIIKRKY